MTNEFIQNKLEEFDEKFISIPIVGQNEHMSSQEIDLQPIIRSWLEQALQQAYEEGWRDGLDKFEENFSANKQWTELN